MSAPKLLASACIGILLASFMLSGCNGNSRAVQEFTSRYDCVELGWRADQKAGPDNKRISLWSCASLSGEPPRDVDQCLDETDAKYLDRATSKYEDAFAACYLNGPSNAGGPSDDGYSATQTPDASTTPDSSVDPTPDSSSVPIELSSRGVTSAQWSRYQSVALSTQYIFDPSDTETTESLAVYSLDQCDRIGSETIGPFVDDDVSVGADRGDAWLYWSTIEDMC